MNTATATMRMRSILQNAAAIAIAAAALAVTTANAHAQSFLDGKSNGMTRCVNHILNGRGTIKKVNVHGHHFDCRRMSRSNTERANFRQIHLRHVQIGWDDEYTVNFKVDAQNRIILGTFSVHIRKGVSFVTVLKASSLLGNIYYQGWFLARQIRKLPIKFTAPRFKDYEAFAAIARAVPAMKVKKWETAAFEIAAITIAEHGRALTRRPTPTIPTQTTSQLNR